ncbi:DNA mismatch repair protein spellchecker 1 [Gryllus bimaculatus]|nr:DNA mismatch repair protein spellchecker 1 [Gryllus bimaculatus]
MAEQIPDSKKFIPFFKALPEKTSSTIRFFNRGDYYTVHGSDAIFVAKELYKTTSCVKIYGSENNTLESLSLSKSNFESFVRELLLVKQYRVEVYVNKGRVNADWVAEFKGSPGNLQQFEDILFSNNEQMNSTAVIAVKIGGEGKNKVVGLGYVSVSDKQLSVCEFPDDDHFTNLEGLLVQLGPKECLLPASESSQDYNTIKEVMEKSGVMVTPRKKNEFTTTDLALDLNKLVHFQEGQQDNAMALPEMSLQTAMAGIAAIIKYLEVCGEKTYENVFSVNTLDLSRYVHMDAAAVKALNIFPPSSSTPADANNSILGLLDKCRTPQGRRLLMQWIKQPLRDVNAITERHDVVEVLINNPETFNNMYEKHLCQVPDFHNLSRRLLHRKATLQECYRIYQAVSTLPEMVTTLKAPQVLTKLQAVFVEPLEELLGDMEGFKKMIDSTLDMEEVEKGNYLIKSSFDPDLEEYRSTMDAALKDMENQVPKVASDLGLEAGKSVKLESSPHLGYYCRITLKEEKILRNKKQYEIIDTSKSGVRFRNAKMSHLNSTYQEAWSKYNEQQKSVVTDLIDVAESLHSLGNVTAQLDVLTSFANVAKACPQNPYVRPVMHEMGSGVLSLKQVRHPCIELSVQFVANDVYFKQGECTFSIITGPNMGGKSTYIRSVGVIVLLAQMGCFVPCESAEISVVDGILARVGADDCQVKGMSTFMKEMVETSSILRTATKNSLVIIDELGRGTSTYEGCGIAWAIAEHLAKEVKAFCLFATHFHELTHLAEEVSTVQNYHVEAIITKDKLALTHDVKPGPSDESFGIHDAKSKQAELEDYQGLNFASDRASKRTIIKEGKEIMNQFLEKCKKLDVDKMSESEVMQEIDKYKEEVKAKNNPYIEALFLQLSS